MGGAERERLWRLAVGGDDTSLDTQDQHLPAALTALYGAGDAQAGDAQASPSSPTRLTSSLTSWPAPCAARISPRGPHRAISS